MKGIVFTEFLEMVEREFGLEVVDRLTSLPALSSQGAYTAVGNYPHADLVAMLDELHAAVGRSHADLVHGLGGTLFSSFGASHPEFVSSKETSLDFLEGIESEIHREVRKLYSDAVLPTFECERPRPDQLVMRYSSSRPFADLAEGLIQAAVNHFPESVEIVREPGPTGDGHSAVFTLTLVSPA